MTIYDDFVIVIIDIIRHDRHFDRHNIMANDTKKVDFYGERWRFYGNHMAMMSNYVELCRIMPIMTNNEDFKLR